MLIISKTEAKQVLEQKAWQVEAGRKLQSHLQQHSPDRVGGIGFRGKMVHITKLYNQTKIQKLREGGAWEEFPLLQRKKSVPTEKVGMA